MIEEVKRRKDKYNPYKLYISSNEKYFIKIKNLNSNSILIEVDKRIYMEMNKFELEDKSQMNKYDRHIEHSQITDVTLNKRAINLKPSIEEIVCYKIERELVHKAISMLPEVQKKRINMYFLENLTQQEIADIDKVSIRAVQYSIENGLKNLKKLLN